MKVLTVCGLLAVMVLFSANGIALAGMWDNLKSATIGGNSSGVSQSDIDSYLDLSKKADDLQQGSLDCLAKILLNKEVAEEIERKRAAAQGIQDLREKEAEINRINTDAQARLQQQLDGREADKKIGQLDSQQKQLAGSAISNLFLSALNNKAAATVATGIVQKAEGNPASAVTFAKELPRIKNAVVGLPEKAEKTYTLANQLLKLAKTNNIEVVVPKTAADAPREVDIS